MEMIEGDKNEREVVFDEKNNNQQQQYDGRNKTPSKSTYTNINNSNQQKGFKNPNVNNNNDDQFRNELHYNNHNNMNQQQYQRYDSEDVYTLNKKFNKPNSTQRLQDKKQFPKQLTPMTDLHKLTEKLEKQNSLQTNNLGNPIFQEKNKINKLNKLKPLDSQVENADNLNILLSHHQNNHNNSNVTPLQNISNKQQELKKPYKNSIKLEKLTEVAN